MASSRRTGGNEDVATYGAAKDHTEGNFATWEEATDVDQVTATASRMITGGNVLNLSIPIST